MKKCPIWKMSVFTKTISVLILIMKRDDPGKPGHCLGAYVLDINEG